jgi:hypothetical protein
MKKWCVIQLYRRVNQLSTVDTFTRRWVTDTTGTCFILLRICHWRWIWWWRNPTLERVELRRLSPIIQEKRCLYRTPRVHQSTKRIYTYPTWIRKETCKCQITQYSYMQSIITHTLIRAIVVSMSGHARVS